MMTTAAGVHAARMMGIVPLEPKAKIISVQKCSKNPVTTPDTMSMPIFPRRGERRENTAAINTVPASKNGAESKLFQYNLCFNAENPASSSVLIKLGKCQNDMVSGEAKLSWICSMVSVVGRL